MGKETIEVERQVTQTEEKELIICDSCGYEVEEDQDMIRYGEVDDVSDTPRVFLHEKPCAQNMDWVDVSDPPDVVGSDIRGGEFTIISAHSDGAVMWTVPVALFVAGFGGRFSYIFFSDYLVMNTALAFTLITTILLTCVVVFLMGRIDKGRLVEENF